MSVLMKNEQMIAGLVPSEESVSVTADGSKSYTTLLNELYALIDYDKLNPSTKLCWIALQDGTIWNTSILPITKYISDLTRYDFGGHVVDANNTLYSYQLKVASTNSQFIVIAGNSRTDSSTTVPTNGSKFVIYY